jgi:hypothetical protein
MIVEWLDPWVPVEAIGERLAYGLLRQLQIELPPGHVLYGVPVKVLARGNGDDVLFELLDGTNRVADVHLTWSKGQERLPWPGTDVYSSLRDWVESVMEPEHRDWEN